MNFWVELGLLRGCSLNLHRKYLGAYLGEGDKAAVYEVYRTLKNILAQKEGFGISSA